MKNHFNLFVAVLICLSIEANAQGNLQNQSPELANAFSTKDTIFKSPYIDIDEWREKPVKHRYVHGGFKGTETRFSLYFPPKEQYQGRFFQYITPFPDNENISQGATGEYDIISFSIQHGAYFVETNGGGKIDFAKPSFNSDPTIGAYKANAAVAQYSKTLASQFFGNHRTYGYAFGGSGGAYRTVGSIENTNGVWDGVVPHVMGSPMAIPNVFSVRMQAMRVLYDKFPQIIDAMDAGGSGNMYAGLNDEEKEVLAEVTKMGFPPQSWFGYKTMGVHGFIALYQGVVMADGKYFDDFWKVKGYFGANPSASLLKARFQRPSKIKAGVSLDNAIKLGIKEPASEGERGSADLAWKSLGGVEGAMPVAFQLEDVLPNVNFMGGDLIIKSGESVGKTIQLVKAEGDYVVFGPVDPSVLVKIKEGDEVYIDNSNFLASQYYHRHQVPGKEYKVWDQFRDTEGKPLYPQRPMLLGPLFTQAASGVLPTGKFKGKMILVESLWDREAFPWQADWYHDRVKGYLGDSTEKQFRIWFTDHALHGGMEDPTRTVSYVGVVHQALLDVSQWAEKGIVPAPTTSYKIEDGQVIVPATATERKGIQPIIDLRVSGGKRHESTKGKLIKFEGTIDIPENTGKIVSLEWDFEGEGTFAEKADMSKLKISNSGNKVVVKGKHSFAKSGTFFPTLRVTTHREGDTHTPFARIQNLDRVRVIIK